MIISNEGNYYAGCWMIALGQTLAYLEYPKHDSLDWAAMKQVWNYQNYDKKDEREASDLNNLMVADLIYNLYKRCKAHPTSLADNSGFRSTAASILNVSNAMVELGFENVSEVDYDADLVWRRMILYPSAPSLIRANNTNAPLSSGHAWVIDGFMQLEYTPVALHPLSLPHARVKKLFHCNWGYGGASDGYYLTALFDLQQGPLLLDENIRDNHAGTQLQDPSSNYSNNITILTYDHPNHLILYN